MSANTIETEVTPQGVTFILNSTVQESGKSGTLVTMQHTVDHDVADSHYHDMREVYLTGLGLEALSVRADMVIRGDIIDSFGLTISGKTVSGDFVTIYGPDHEVIQLPRNREVRINRRIQ